MAIVYNPQSEMLREPNLLVPGKKAIHSVRLGDFEYKNNIKRVWFPSAAQNKSPVLIGQTEPIFYGDSSIRGNSIVTTTASGSDVYLGEPFDEHLGGRDEPHTLIVRTTRLNQGTSEQLYWGQDEGGSGWALRIGFDSDGTAEYVVILVPSSGQSSGGAGYSTSGGVFAPGSKVTMVGVFRPGVSIKLFVNGIHADTTAVDRDYLRQSNGEGTRGKGMVIGRNESGTSLASSFDFSAMLDYAVPDSIASDLSIDPYQFLIPA